MSTLLVADIGGTKIDFALIDSDRPGFVPLNQGQLESGSYQSCAEVIAACLEIFKVKVDFACLAVAGPVSGQEVFFTNLPWHTGEQALKDEFGFAGVVLVNDLVAMAAGVELLQTEDVSVLKSGRTTEGGGRLVVAPGTGLGASFICGHGSQSWVQATEAGHLGFVPRTEIERQLFSFLLAEHGHVSFEMVCSGMGLENIFSFFESTGLPVPEELAEKRRLDLPLAPLLASRALEDDIDCPISSKTCALFFDVLAEFCGNMAVAFLPYAGIYFGGGLLPRIISLMNKERFVSRFEDRGLMQDLVSTIPIFLITHPTAPMLGAYKLGRRTFNNEE